jgi:hypothetical protein
LLQTPTTVQTDEPPEKMRARAERNGYKNGTKFGSLTSQIKYDPKVRDMLWPTPLAGEYRDAAITENNAMKGLTDNIGRVVSRLAYGINKDGSPRNGTDGSSTDLLPTPEASMWKDQTITESTARMGDIHQERLPRKIAKDIRAMDGFPTDGEPFRLSPLFTEEMMGFPLMWTTFPFLKESGAPKPSKPTATPSSPK